MHVCKRVQLRAAALAIGASASGGVLALSVPPSPRAASAPLFTFGIIADVQWADAEDGSNYDRTVVRHYRGAFRTLQRAVDWWRALPEPPSFIAQLGDIIDGVNVRLGQSAPALEAALSELRRAPCPSVNLVGNHELYNFDRRALAAAGWLRHGDREYYSFSPAAGWRVVVLDPYQLALIGHAQDDPRRLAAVELLRRKNPGVHPSGSGGAWFEGVRGYDRRFVPYNGGLGGRAAQLAACHPLSSCHPSSAPIGEEQLRWLRSELAAASAAGERVIVLCHVILEPRACGGSTMAWDYEEALEAVRSGEAGGCVAAVLCGHDHSGKYHCDDAGTPRARPPPLDAARVGEPASGGVGVHHCTFSSPLNKGDEGCAFGVVHVFADAIEIRGPRVDDALPIVRGGKPTGRPAARRCAADAFSGECESVRLPLRPAAR